MEISEIEQWKDVVGYENLYMVSDHGQVKSILFRNNQVVKAKEKILRQHKSKARRMYVCLYKNGIRTTKTVHRLVATAFLPNPLNKAEVNHIDGNPSNNNLTNLEWVTKKENMKHAYANNLNPYIKNLNERKSKKIIRSDGVMFASIRGCAREMNVVQASVRDCLTHRKGQKSCKGYTFEYL